MPTRNLIISNLWQLVTADTNNLPTKVKNTYIPAPTIDGLSLGGVKQGNNITIALDGTISASGGGGGGTLQSLTDVSIVEPSFITTGNTISVVNASTLIVSNTPPLLLLAGDWIRGDATANAPVVQITNITNNTISVATTAGYGFAPSSGIYKVSSITLSGQALTWDVATNKWIAKAQSYGTIQSASTAVPQRPAVQFIGAGVSSVADDPVNNRTIITITGGGGGGGTFTASAVWTGGTSNKDAYSAPSVVNNAGITINLVASSGSGGISAASVSLNGVALPNIYASTGAWPNLTITIPVADLTGNAAEIANTVAISLTGTFGGSGVNITNAGTLTNAQPALFNTTLSGSYNITSAPFYTTTATLNWIYSNTTGTIQAYGGTFTPGGAANTAVGSFAGIAITGSTIGGVAIGTGTAGAGSRTINLSGQVAAVPTFIPAFWVQTTDASVPTFSAASSQTPGAAVGSIITYTVATAPTQYNWICTQRPLANLILRTPFGDGVLVPDVTAPTQTIAGQVFNVFGWNGLIVGSASILVIT